MAVVRWLGVDGDLSNTANYSTGALPSAGDSLQISQGSISITTGLTALSAIALSGLLITNGFTGNIGTNGTSIELLVNNATAGTIYIAMGGAYIYAKITSYNVTGPVTKDITVGSTGSGTFYLTAGSFANCKFVGGSTGRCVIGSGVTMGDVYSAGASIDVTPAFTTCILNGGGSSVLRADVTTVTLGANTACTLEGTGVDVTTINCHGGSRLILNNGGATAGVITTANAYPGSYIANGGKYDNTITTLNAWVGSTQVLQQASSKTTATTTTPVGQK